MRSPDVQLASRARDYLEGRSSFDELYFLAGKLLPRLMQGPESGRTLACANLAAKLSATTTRSDVMPWQRPSRSGSAPLPNRYSAWSKCSEM